MDPEDTLAAARRRHARGELPARRPAHGARSSPRARRAGSRTWSATACRSPARRTGGSRSASSARTPTAAPAFAGDYTGLEIQRTLVQPRRRSSASRSSTRSTSRGCSSRDNAVFGALRVRPRRRHALRHPRRRGHPRRRRPHPDLAAHVVAPRREHGRRVAPRRGGRRPAPRPRARPVPPVRHDRARERGRHAGLRGGARRRRHPPQRASASASWRGTTPSGWSCRPATGSRWPSTPRSRRAAAPRTAGSGSTCRTSRARRSCAGCPASTRRCSSCRCSTSPSRRSRSRRPRTTRWAACGCARRTTAPTSRASTRSARRERTARREPARRQLAGRAARLRPDRRRGGRRAYSAALPSQQRSAAAVAEARAEIDELLASDGPENVRALQRGSATR